MERSSADQSLAMMAATTSKALTYAMAVRDTFKDEMEKYCEFLEILKDFKAQRIDGPGAVAELKAVLEGHRNLMEGLNIFLPKNHQIILPSEDGQPQQEGKPALIGSHNLSVAMSGGQTALTVADGIVYVNTVKSTLCDEMHKYYEFLKVLRDFGAQSIGTSEVVARVKRLFEGHRDLILGFKAFLPKGYPMKDDDDDEQPWLDDLVLVLSKL